MFIDTSDLGFREIKRLISFIELMIKDYPADCIDCIFDYDLHRDEPFILREGLVLNTVFYASDYDIAFNVSNEAEYI